MYTPARVARSVLLFLAAILALPAAHAQTSVAGSGLSVGLEQPYLAMPQLVLSSGLFPTHSSGTPGEFASGGYIGFVHPLAGFITPGGSFTAQGQILPIASFVPLFALVGTTYGGNGTTNFGLPNLSGATKVNVGAAPGLSLWSLGEFEGSVSTTLLTANLPAHAHVVASGGSTGAAGSQLPFPTLQPTLGMTRLIVAEGIMPSTAGPNAAVVGMIATFGGNFAPPGYLFADGALYNITDYPDLYSVIGTTYGGDGINNFAVPDLRGRITVGVNPSHPLGSTFGAETVTLNSNNLPFHTHTGPGGTTGGAGSNFPFNKAQPSIAMHYIIAPQGLYPCDGCGAFDSDVPFLGQVAEFAGSAIPDGWLTAQGQLLAIVSNSALFSLLGTTYGGDGVNVFQLPDFRGRTLVGTGSSYVSGQQSGSETETLVQTTMPPHVHTSPPFEPVIGTATAGTGQASVTFAAPGNTGGLGITGYTVTSNPGGFTGTGGASPIVVPGLANGTPYTFTVTATNALGPGAPSAASNSVTPVAPTAPDPPTIGLATAGNGQGTIAFTPGFDGNSPITGYTATCSPGGATGTNGASPIVVAGLNNGTAYTCTVTAANIVGPSAPSAASNAFTPSGPQTITFANPGAQNFGTSPTLTATATSSLTVTFTSSTTGVCTITSGGTLTFVTAGTCTIDADQAGNAAFTPAPTVSQSFTVNAVAPGAPTIGVAVAGDTVAAVAFSAPGFTGGAAITLYIATASPGGATGSAAASPVGIAGLTNGVSYTFTVTASNIAGPGPASAASNAVTPRASQSITFANPGTQNFGTSPTLTATATSSLTVTFTSSTTGVCTITAGGTLTFVTAGTCTINADQAGNGSFLAAPQVSQSFTVAPIAPGAPTIGTATAGDTQASVTFSAPGFTGGSAVTGYTATANPGGATGGGAGSPIVVTGLTNGVSYTFTVTASNIAGPGPASAASNAVTPRASQAITFANPGAQVFGTSPTLTASATSTLTVTFTSSTVGVCTITSGGTLTFVAAGTCTISADQPGNASFLAAPQVSQSFTVAAVAPGAPVIGTATPGNQQVSVSFSPPASTGGSPITQYTAACLPGPFSASGPASPIVVPGLVNGVPYTCAVVATNIAGTGPSSGTATATPLGQSFTGPTGSGSGIATVSFTGGGPTCSFAPQGNGPLQSAFFIPVTGHPKSPGVPPPPDVTFFHGLLDFVLLGCTPGSTVSFTVTYPFAVPGDTSYYKYGPTPDNGSAHWYKLPAAIAGNTISFTITDGGLGDDDLAANGTVVDQGGPGSSSPLIPTLSGWMMALLSLLLLAGGVSRMRRVRAPG